MNVIVVDTSSWINYFEKGEREDELDLALQEARVYVPSIVIAELMSGKYTTSQRNNLKDFLLELPICQNDFSHWENVGLLRAKLARKGISVSTPDAHVAQSCLDIDGYLLSKDRIFAKISKHLKLKLLPS